MAKKITKKEMLNLKINSSDFPDDVTVKDYFKMLLDRLWDEGEGFSGKRPFGNSGWEHDLYGPLVISGAVKGVIDEDGYIDEYDEKAANALISKLIAECFK